MAAPAPPAAPPSAPPPRPAVPRRRRRSLRAPLLIVFLLAAAGGVVALGPRLLGLSPTQAVETNPAMAQVAQAVGLVPTPVPTPTRDPRIPYCDPAHPSFVYGFAALKLQVGPKMGNPLECEQVVSPQGDTRQRTTTGYAYYRTNVNVPAFTNGVDHWALTTRGLVYWAGDVVDPPGPELERTPPAE